MGRISASDDDRSKSARQRSMRPLGSFAEDRPALDGVTSDLSKWTNANAALTTQLPLFKKQPDGGYTREYSSGVYPQNLFTEAKLQLNEIHCQGDDFPGCSNLAEVLDAEPKLPQRKKRDPQPFTIFLTAEQFTQLRSYYEGEREKYRGDGAAPAR